MKIEIRYFTKTGNTKKLAEAIAQELNIEAQELSAPLSEKTDILFCVIQYIGQVLTAA